ncbi:MAG: CBS domain-containing protein [Methanobacteriota archaeon]|nr:MAG: CBS domain-containing protein [Euryarchaeota archaeon]
MKLRDVIRASSPEMLPPDSTVADALVAMVENKTDFAIIDRTGIDDAYGIISRWDIVVGPIAEGKNLLEMQALSCARKPVVVMNNLDADIRWVAKKMANENISKIAVFDKEDFLGVVSDTDLIRAVSSKGTPVKKEEEAK